MLNEENLKKFELLKTRFQTLQALTLPVLWMIQEQEGWISTDSMQYVAQLLNVPFSHVYGVVTFYTMYNPEPVGKYHLQVCTNISCMLNGGDELCDHISKKLGIGMGETTPDKRFTLHKVECLGSCGTAPMMQVNDDFYENLSLPEVDRLLEELR